MAKANTYEGKDVSLTHAVATGGYKNIMKNLFLLRLVVY